jgi:hypothetical protein
VQLLCHLGRANSHFVFWRRPISSHQSLNLLVALARHLHYQTVMRLWFALAISVIPSVLLGSSELIKNQQKATSVPVTAADRTSFHCGKYLSLVREHSDIFNAGAGAYTQRAEELRKHLNDAHYPAADVERYVRMFLLEEVFNSGLVHEAVLRSFRHQFGTKAAAIRAVENFSLLEKEADQLKMVDLVVEQLLQLMPSSIDLSNLSKLHVLANQMNVQPEQLKLILRKIRELKAEDPELYVLRSSIYSLLYTDGKNLSKGILNRAGFRQRIKNFVNRLRGRGMPQSIPAPKPENEPGSDIKFLLGKESSFLGDSSTYLEAVNSNTREFFLFSHYPIFNPTELKAITAQSYFESLPLVLKTRINARLSDFEELVRVAEKIVVKKGELEVLQNGASSDNSDFDARLFNNQMATVDSYYRAADSNASIQKILGTFENLSSSQFAKVALRIIQTLSTYTTAEPIISGIRLIYKASKKVKLEQEDLRKIKQAALDEADSFTRAENTEKVMELVNRKDWGSPDLPPRSPTGGSEKETSADKLKQEILELESLLKEKIQALNRNQKKEEARAGTQIDSSSLSETSGLGG